MSRRAILVIEDDAAIRRGLVDVLELEGFETVQAADGRVGLELAIVTECVLVLLDLMLPHVAGMDILREIRRVRPTLPVIILTARGEERDRVLGLREGADDYVVKPFSRAELVARITAVLRRSPERPSDIHDFRLEGVTVDLARSELCFDDGERVGLSEREAELLRYFAINAGRVVSREEILARVWRLEPSGLGETRTIDMHVARLREKLRDNGGRQRILRTVRGRGYTLELAGAAPAAMTDADA